MHGVFADSLPALLESGMSPGGARPKIVIGINGDSIISGTQRLPDGFEYWLLKFHTAITKSDDGLIEEAYSRMVKESGINMPETQLLDVNGTRFFAVKRFDRVFNEFRHIHSLAGLVNADFRQPDFDYEKLFRVTKMLTNNNEDLEQIYKQMVFNVLSHNQDDHTKNFSFTTDGDGIWRSSPAYDITFNSSVYGEQSMALMGCGKNIPDQVLLNWVLFAVLIKRMLRQYLSRFLKCYLIGIPSRVIWK